MVVAIVLEAFRSGVSRTPSQTRASAPGWLSLVMREVGVNYGKAEALAVTSYRLERALRTGRATGAPWRNDPVEPLYRLRREFVQAVNDIAPRLPREMGYPDPVDGGELVEVDLIDDLLELMEESSALTERLTRQSLDTVGPENYIHRAAKAQADELEDLFDSAAAAAAAEAARAARRGGRSTRETIRDRDSLVVGYARVCAKPGSDTHPCGFCSMLMSRGLVYRSERSAFGRNPDGYHTNCDCEPVEVWSQEQFDTDERFDRNRLYKQMWADQIHGKYSGRDALNAWRSIIDKLNKQEAAPAAAPETPETALEAAA